MGTIISGERRRSVDELHTRAARAATGLRSLGVGTNDRIAIVMRNDLEFFEAMYAARLLGAYSVPINWHFTEREIAYVLADCGAKAVICHADLLPQVRPASDEQRVTCLAVETPIELRIAYGLDDGPCVVPPGQLAWSTWLQDFAPCEPPAGRGPGSMIYTSGTTGHPKGVARKPRASDGGARTIVNTVFKLRPGMRTVITGPMYHSAPNGYAAIASMMSDTLVLQPRFDPEDLLRLIEAHRITHLHMVPTMFVRMLKLSPEVRNRYDTSSLQAVVHAAAPCPPAVKRAMIEWLGPVIDEYYGSTETGPVTFCDSEQWLAHEGTVGKVLANCTVRILDDAGRPLPAGQVGEVYCRNDSFGDFTYHGDPNKRAASERDGLITVGDVGYLDEDGFLYLCDRKRDMVISGGVNIYPAEIEAELLELEGVHDCAVFGIPDEEYGESLCAYVQPEAHSQLTAEDVQQFLRARKARYMVPKLVEFRDELPREDSGKIFKRKLRDPYWKQTGRSI